MDTRDFLTLMRGMKVDFTPETAERWFSQDIGSIVREEIAAKPLEQVMREHLVFQLDAEAMGLLLNTVFGGSDSLDGNRKPKKKTNVCEQLSQFIRRDRDDLHYPETDGVSHAKVLFILKLMEQMVLKADVGVYEGADEPINAHYAVTETSKMVTPTWNSAEYNQYPEITRELAYFTLQRMHDNTQGGLKRLIGDHLAEAMPHHPNEGLRLKAMEYMLGLGVQGTAPVFLALCQAGAPDTAIRTIVPIMTHYQGLAPRELYQSIDRLFDLSGVQIPHVWVTPHPKGLIPRLHPTGTHSFAFNALSRIGTPEAMGVMTRAILRLITPYTNGGDFAQVPPNIRRAIPTISACLQDACLALELPGVKISRALLSVPDGPLDAKDLTAAEFEALTPFLLSVVMESERLVGAGPECGEGLRRLGCGTVKRLWSDTLDGSIDIPTDHNDLPNRLMRFEERLRGMCAQQPRALDTARDMAALPMGADETRLTFKAKTVGRMLEARDGAKMQRLVRMLQKGQ